MKFSLLLLAALSLSCGSDKSSSSGGNDNHPAQSIAFFQSSSVIDLEVWYEAKAEPYVKAGLSNDDLWKTTRNNLNAIFQFRSKAPTVTVPSTLAEMHSLETQNKESYTSEDILALAAKYKTADAPAGTSRFKVFFLNAYFHDSSGVNKNVLGVSIGDSMILAMFKPVIASTAQAGPLDRTAQLVEQSTLVHEMGHALGFVNNGVPMVKDYQDTAHGAHSKNEDDVMYWANETTDNITKFVSKFLTAGDEVLWGPEVLADAKAISK